MIWTRQILLKNLDHQVGIDHLSDARKYPLQHPLYKHVLTRQGVFGLIILALVDYLAG